MRILYLDCFSGISGDMTVGALADLGITPSTFEWELSKLNLGDCHLHFERQTRGGISGVKFDVHSGQPTSLSGCCITDPCIEADLTHQQIAAKLATTMITTHDMITTSSQARRSPRRQPIRPASFSEIRALDQAERAFRLCQTACDRQSFAESAKQSQRFTEWPSRKSSFMKSAHSIRSSMSCSPASASKRSRSARIYFSSWSTVKALSAASHGEYPLPGPATLEILQRYPDSPSRRPI